VFAIAFDLDTTKTRKAHPKGLTQAYLDIRGVLEKYGYISVYTSDNEDLAGLVMAMNALKAQPWFPASVRDIRAFRVEQWSDFTSFMQS
jgi:virulence-associated protein VapD